jgi:hypothetical protein
VNTLGIVENQVFNQLAAESLEIDKKKGMMANKLVLNGRSPIAL